MMKKESITMKKSLPMFLGLLLLVAPIACGNNDEEFQEEVTQEVGELDTSMTQVVDEPVEPEVQAGLTAAVVIDENTIGIEQVLQPGPTVFTIRNSGLNEHSLAISGPGGEWELETALAPGATGNLEVNLAEGSYRVYDPRDENLSTEVVVGTDTAAAQQ